MKFIFSWRESITNKLIILFLLIGIGSTIIVGVYSYYSARRSLIDRTFDQLTSVKFVKKNRIEDFFSDRFRDINLLSRTSEVADMISLLQHTFQNNKKKIFTFPESDKYKQFFNLNVKTYGYYDKFIVCDTAGNYIYTSGLTSDSLHLLGSGAINYLSLLQLKDSVIKKKNIVFSDFRKDNFNNDKPAYYIAAPVFDDRKNFTGMISMLISTNAINNIMLVNSSKTGLGETGESYLVGSDYFMRSDSRFIPNSIMKQQVKSSASIAAFEGKQYAEIINDYRNIPVLSSYCKLNIPGINWVILAEIDLKEAMIPVEHTRNDILLLSAVLVLFILAITIIIARSISLPIIRLKNASVKVGEGDFGAQVYVKNKDEIGALAASFNAMTEKLKITTEQRLTALIDGQEIERQRISRELHDGLGQYLIAIKLKLENIVGNMAPGSIVQLQEMFDNTIDEVRKISDNLMPSILKEFGPETALKNLCKMISQTSGLNITFESLPLKCKPDDKKSTYLYRIAQEALNNIVKHAEATSVSLQLVELGNHIELIIEDNGKGFNFGQDFRSMGNGIHNMRERTSILGGAFELNSSEGSGTTIVVKIPLHE
ncbi:MAG: HAMP domain-containing protein [Bacteroidales bacterium]|jgi:signal transduction histidine kinase